MQLVGIAHSIQSVVERRTDTEAAVQIRSRNLMTSFRRTVEIRNVKGLHARASAKFVKCAELFEADVKVTRDDVTVSAISIMGLMMLTAGPGVTLTLDATGPEAEKALQALAELVACGFEEECVELDKPQNTNS